MADRLEAVSGSLKAWRNFLEYELSGTSVRHRPPLSQQHPLRLDLRLWVPTVCEGCEVDAAPWDRGLARREMWRIRVEFTIGSCSGSRRELMKSGRVVAGSSRG